MLRLEYDIRVVAKRQSRPLKTEQINANNQCVGSLVYCKLKKKYMQAIASKINFELKVIYDLSILFYESLILAQDERWRRA